MKSKMYGKLTSEFFNYDLTAIYIGSELVGFKYMGKLSAYTDECVEEFKKAGVRYVNDSGSNIKNTIPYDMYLRLTAKKAHGWVSNTIN